MDYFEWYNRRATFVQILLFPLLLAAILVHMILVVAIVLLAVLPCYAVKGALQHRRFWRRLRTQGQVARWSDVAPQLARGAGTLVVELGPKGPGCCWWIDAPRTEVDPDRVVPSWHEFQERGWSVFEPEAKFERITRWATGRLGAYQSSVQALAPSWRKLNALPREAQREAVVVLVCGTDGSPTRRCA